jgi:multidrug resistance efflux pump
VPHNDAAAVAALIATTWHSATVIKAKAQLQLAQENYDRQAQLFQKNVVAQATLDTMHAHLRSSIACIGR